MKALVKRKNRTVISNDRGRTSWSIGDRHVLCSKTSKAQPMYIEHVIFKAIVLVASSVRGKSTRLVHANQSH